MQRLLATGLTALAIFGPATTAGAGSRADDRVVVRGRATLDGAPFDAQFLGAAVEQDGLVTPCQVKLPRVRDGRFEIPVFARTEATGCGARGAEIFLWTFVQEQIVYSSESVPWPGNGKTVRFRPTFSVAAPNGGVGQLVGFAGEAFDHAGRRAPDGIEVEAFIGTTLCGVASTRTSGDFTGFSINVVGPDAIPGCELGATITFRIDDRPAAETAINAPGQEDSLDLTLA